MAELCNVIVFALDGVRMATELRFVREVATLGFVTEVPTAPLGISGLCNLHGTIVPVLDLHGLHDDRAGTPPRQGDGALVFELDGTIAALRVDEIDEVATLSTTGGGAGAAVVDRRGRRLPLIDPRELMARARARVGVAEPGAAPPEPPP